MGELSRDGNLEIDGRADIYSLGLVIYEMIIGRRPYSAATLHELRRDHVSVTPPPLVEKAPVCRALLAMPSRGRLRRTGSTGRDRW